MLSQKISVALCTYNGARHLGAQLDSIAAQTRKPDELVLCDDGSRDDTVKIAEHFARTAPFDVRIVRNNRTLGSTKNFDQTIRLCNGDAIALSDQDDIWLPHKLATLEAEFERSPDTDALFTNADIVDEHLKSLGYKLWSSVRFSPREQFMIRSGNALSVLMRHNVATGATMIFRSRWRDFLLPIPEEGVHDAWIALLIASAGTLQMIDECLILYRQHDSNQIGARRRGLKYRLQRPCEAALKDSVHTLKQMKEVAARVQAHSLTKTRPALASRLAAKIQHLEARIEIATHEEDWLHTFVNEVRTGRYHEYSMGWWSVVHDVVKCFPRRANRGL